ncbi:MAG: hypothetical protein RLY14_131 [Planctomycetota bacterium]
MLRLQCFAVCGFVLLSMFSAGCCCIKTHCGSSGCGEVYVDEWWNHPPTEDPCTTCGEYAGSCGCGASHISHHGCGSHSCLGNGCDSHGCAHGSCLPLLNRLCGLWGIRYEGPARVVHGGCSSCGEVGCSSCGGGVVSSGGGYVSSAGASYCPSCAAGHAGHSHEHVGGESIIEHGTIHQDAGHDSGHEPTPAKIEPQAEAHAPEAGHSARSTSPALRKRTAVQQASAVKPLRRR